MSTTTWKEKKKWFSFSALILAAGTIYKLGSMSSTFYIPMQEYMGLTHTQIGFALSLKNFIATFGFLFSIYLADRFSKKIMIPTALIGSGIVGLFLSTLPSYKPFLVSYCLMAIFADMLFWPVMLKTVRLLGNEKEQGRMFGILEGGRGLVDTVVAFASLAVFAALGSAVAGLRGAYIFYSVLMIVIGIFAYILLEPDQISDVNSKGERVGKNKIAFDKMLLAIKTKSIWLVAFNVFMVYSVYCGLTFFIPFLKEIYGLPVVLVGAYGIINQYGLKMLGGPIGGFVSDKVLGSATKFLRIVFIITAVVLIVFINLPHESMNVYLGMGLSLLIAAFVFTMRAVFFAPMEEVKVPREITGSAMSLGSLIGYLPGAFLFTVYGNILDTNPGMTGYKIVFTIMAVFAILGSLLSAYILKQIKEMGDVAEYQDIAS